MRRLLLVILLVSVVFISGCVDNPFISDKYCKAIGLCTVEEKTVEIPDVIVIKKIDIPLMAEGRVKPSRENIDIIVTLENRDADKPITLTYVGINPGIFTCKTDADCKYENKIINPGQEETFSFKVTSPDNPGTMALEAHLEVSVKYKYTSTRLATITYITKDTYIEYLQSGGKIPVDIINVPSDGPVELYLDISKIQQPVIIDEDSGTLISGMFAQMTGGIVFADEFEPKFNLEDVYIRWNKNGEWKTVWPGETASIPPKTEVSAHFKVLNKGDEGGHPNLRVDTVGGENKCYKIYEDNQDEWLWVDKEWDDWCTFNMPDLKDLDIHLLTCKYEKGKDYCGKYWGQDESEVFHLKEGTPTSATCDKLERKTVYGSGSACLNSCNLYCSSLVTEPRYECSYCLEEICYCGYNPKEPTPGPEPTPEPSKPATPEGKYQIYLEVMNKGSGEIDKIKAGSLSIDFDEVELGTCSEEFGGESCSGSSVSNTKDIVVRGQKPFRYYFSFDPSDSIKKDLTEDKLTVTKKIEAKADYIYRVFKKVDILVSPRAEI